MVNHKTFVIMSMLQKINQFLLIVFTFLLLMVAVNKTMDYFICKNYLLRHYKKYYYNS